MGNQYIDISRDIRNMLTLTVCNAIGHEHGDAVKLHTVNSDAACSEIVTVVIQTIDIGIIQAIVVVAGNEYLMGIRQVTCGLTATLTPCTSSFVPFRIGSNDED